MASVKVILYKSKTLKGDSHPVMIRVFHKKLRYVSTGVSSTEDEWDENPSELNSSKKNYKRLNLRINNLYLKLENRIIELESTRMEFTVDDIIRAVKTQDTHTTFFQYTEKIIKELNDAKKIGNRDMYKTMLSAVKKYTNTDFFLEELDYKWLKGFESYFYSRGVSVNGLNVYMRTIRAVLNRAIKEKILGREHYPFVEYKIKFEKPAKRAISKEDLKKIKELELKKDSDLWHSQNMFLFSFYTLGMSWIDMAYLRIENIKQGRVFYKRAKTGKEYNIALTQQAKEILDYYTAGKKKREYVFPIVERDKDPELLKADVKNALKQHNKFLKILAEKAGVDEHLTSYVARHSWATIANKSGVHIGIISEALGHEDIKTTQTYLGSFGSEELDNANLKISDL